jgi:hypothetical protein
MARDNHLDALVAQEAQRGSLGLRGKNIITGILQDQDASLGKQGVIPEMQNHTAIGHGESELCTL